VADLISVSGTKSRDYHGSMNEENFEYWLLTQLLSLIVMDSVPYYSVLMVKLPTQQENSIYSLPRGISQS
jgi:hypothetical protein